MLGYNYSMRKEKSLVVALRAKGMTYREIQDYLGIKIPKGTMSHWCVDVPLTKTQQKRIETMNTENLERGRARAIEVTKEKRASREQQFKSQNQHLLSLYSKEPSVRKIVLAILHLAEGHKRSSTVVFGNSDPEIIAMFIDLLRTTYKLDKSKFRITVQCRADQNSQKLAAFWSKLTQVPLTQFYKTQVDKRTLGVPTKKKGYMGVCRVDYLSAIIDQELKYVARMLKTR